MQWVAPPKGSAADRVLDNLGRIQEGGLGAGVPLVSGVGTLRGPGIWRSRRLVGGEASGWRGTCRRLRLGTVAPPKKLILLRLRRFGMWSGGVGRGRTRGGRLTGSRRRRAEDVGLDRARARTV